MKPRDTLPYRSPKGGDNTLRQAWEEQAGNWVRWARQPEHDSYWRFHRDAFLSLVPPPGRLTLDIGCAEGRLARDLKAGGHRVVAIDASPTLVAHAREAAPSMNVLLADAARLPLPDQAAYLAVAFMSLHDMDDMPGAIREAFRVLVSRVGGSLIKSPMNLQRISGPGH